MSLNKPQRKIDVIDSSKSFLRINDKEDHPIYTLSPPSRQKEGRGSDKIFIEGNTFPSREGPRQKDQKAPVPKQARKISKGKFGSLYHEPDHQAGLTIRGSN